MRSIRESDVEFESGAVALAAQQRQLLVATLGGQPMQCVAEVIFQLRTTTSDGDFERMMRLAKARAAYLQEVLEKSGVWPEGLKPMVAPSHAKVQAPMERSTVLFIGC